MELLDSLQASMKESFLHGGISEVLVIDQVNFGVKLFIGGVHQ